MRLASRRRPRTGGPSADDASADAPEPARPAAGDGDGTPPPGRRRRRGKGGAGARPAGGRRPAKRGWLPELARDRRVEAFGIAILAFGCLVTALVWWGIRDATNVAYQLPIIASGGLVAVGCFAVGGMLLVGGIVMTRFARLEHARRAHLVAPPADAGDVVLTEEVRQRREAVRARSRAADG